MDNPDFIQLNNAVASTTQFMQKYRDKYSRPNAIKDPRQFDALHQLQNDAGYVASMASQALEAADLSVPQRIALKATLSQLEFELRMCDAELDVF